MSVEITRSIALSIGRLAYRYKCTRKLYRASAVLIAPIGKRINPNYRAGEITAYLDRRLAAEHSRNIVYLPDRNNAEPEEIPTGAKGIRDVSAEAITEVLFWEARETLSYIGTIRQQGWIMGASGVLSLFSATAFYTSIADSIFSLSNHPIADSPKDIVLLGLFNIASIILFVRSAKKLKIIERRFEYELARIITLAMAGKPDNPVTFGALADAERLVPDLADETTFRLWHIYFANRNNPENAKVEAQPLIDNARNPEKMKMTSRLLEQLMSGDEKKAATYYRWLQQWEKDKSSDQE